MAVARYNIIGVMSGTSLDGIDMAHIIFTIENGKWQFELIETQTIPYSESWMERLQNAVDLSALNLEILNDDYTQLLGKTIANFIAFNQIYDLDAVCSHGHTVLHQPENGFTLQIGNLPQIARLIQQKVVCDFRVADVLLGGQGAPLVPIGDRMLFPEYDYCLNLGGFSNVSFENEEKRIAFDIAPVNTVLNFYANKLGLPFDDKGAISQLGKINEDLLNTLNHIDFYKKPFPKSLGFEFVKTIILPLIDHYNIPIANKLCTFTEHIAQQAALALPSRVGNMLVTGGGAYNDYMLSRLRHFLPEMKLIVPDHKTLEFKEALIFGLLGVLKLRDEINVLSSVTGAEKDHSSGNIYTAT